MNTPFGTIMSTNDITKFELSAFNREVKVNKPLLQIIATNGWNPYNPLIVTREGHIVDGNGRYLLLIYLCKQNGWNPGQMPISVTYIVDSRKIPEYEKIRQYNGYTKAWTGKDFITAYCKQGIRSYVEVEEHRNKILIGKKPVLSPSHAIMAYTHNKYQTSSQEVKSGHLPIGDAMFIDKVSNFIVDYQISHHGKTPFIAALVAWFTKVYPTLNRAAKDEFLLSMKRYDGNRFAEATGHIAEWYKWVGVSGHQMNAKKRAELLK